MSYPLPAAPAGVDLEAWEAAVAEVRSYCGWHIAPVVTETLTRDGSGGPVLVLPTLRLVDLVSLTEDGTALADLEWSTSGMVYRGGYRRWSPKFRAVVAEIEHGFEEWPADLLRVMADMATTAARGGVASVTSGSHQVSFSSDLGSVRGEVLDRYALPFVQ